MFFPVSGCLYGICIDSDAHCVTAGLLSQKRMNAHSQDDLYLGVFLPTYLLGFFGWYNRWDQRFILCLEVSSDVIQRGAFVPKAKH